MACRVYIIGVFFLSGLLLPVAECNTNHGLISTIRPSHKGSEHIGRLPLKDSSSQNSKKTEHPSSIGLSTIRPSHKGSERIGRLPLKDSSSQNNKKTEHPSSKGLASLNTGIMIIANWSNFRLDWCREELLKQTISEKGCKSRVIANKFCYGQCNSFYIPGYTHKGDILFKSSSSCMPDRFHNKLLVLRCPGLHPPRKEKTVTLVKRCRCMDVK